MKRDPGSPINDRQPRGTPRDLRRALALHALLLPVWGFTTVLAAFGSPSSGITAFLVAGVVWLVVGVLFYGWWSEGRKDLLGRVVVWAFLWWVLFLLFPLLFITGFRRGFVPPPAELAVPPASSTRSQAS